MPEMREEPGGQVWPLRRVYGVQRLQKLQIRQAEDDRREVSELLGRRDCRAPFEARQDLLRLRSLPGVRFRRLGQAAQREVPRVRFELPDREMAESGSCRAVSEQRVQAQASD